MKNLFYNIRGNRGRGYFLFYQRASNYQDALRKARKEASARGDTVSYIKRDPRVRDIKIWVVYGGSK